MFFGEMSEAGFSGLEERKAELVNILGKNKGHRGDMAPHRCGTAIIGLLTLPI